MRKLHVIIIIVFATVLALAVQTLFGNFLSARLATLPGLQNWNLFNPRAPIVVTNRETVRVSDANDAVETASGIKSKLALVVYYEGTGANSHIVLSGGALNWTSDGYFIAPKAALAVPNKTYAVILNNGDIFPVKAAYGDPASTLMMLATDARNQSTAEPIPAGDLRPGEKILLILNAVAENKTTFLESHLRTSVFDVAGQEFNSDRDQRSLGIQPVGVLAPGQAAVNLNGRLAGIWDGTTILTSDTIRAFADNYFSSGKKFERPAFGFSYKQIAKSEARASRLTTGAQVSQVTLGSAAAAAGLLKGDIITSINGKKLDDNILLQSLLQEISPTEIATLEVWRNGEAVPVLITAKLLQ